jgi:hypothetical protein
VGLVSVAGATSRAGKTALAASILRGLPEGAATAVKFTTTDDVFERCPRGTPCVVCDIDVPFQIVTEARVLREPGTDTDRLAAAGARRVVWAIARKGALERAWRRVGELLEPGLWVMEGSTIAFLAKPDLTLFVVHPFLDPARWKDSSQHLLREADVVLINRPAGEVRAPSGAVLEAIRALRGKADARVADVTQPLCEWAPDLAGKVEALVEPAGVPARQRAAPRGDS